MEFHGRSAEVEAGSGPLDGSDGKSCAGMPSSCISRLRFILGGGAQNVAVGALIPTEI